MSIYGPDVSSWQHGSGVKGARHLNWHHETAKMSYVPIDWNAVRNAGNDFAAFKATQGTGYSNPYMPKDSDDAKAAGLIALYYHFADNTDPVAEADYFLSQVSPIMPGEGLALDQEKQSGANVENFSYIFMDRISQKVGFNPFVYLNTWFINNYNWSRDALRFPLWYAYYSYDPKVSPAPAWWGLESMLQYTDKAPVPGISGPVDRNAFYGSREQLLTLCKGGNPMPSTTPAIPGGWNQIVSYVPAPDNSGWYLTGIGFDGNLWGVFYSNMTKTWGDPYEVGTLTMGNLWPK